MGRSTIGEDRKLQRRSSLSRLGNASIINVFSPPTMSSADTPAETDDEAVGNQLQKIKLTGMNPNTKLVYEIINSIFDKKFGYYECSSSSCTSLANQSSEYSFDKRLKYWKDSLAERRYIANSIKAKTGKLAGEVLFNRGSTIDERDKQTVKRLIDFADRMNPIVLKKRQKSRLPCYLVSDECGRQRIINELDETLPKAERDKGTIVEISGLPAIAKEEQLGKRKEQGCEKKYQWMRSKVLEQRIEEKREDIERVIEFYPDIEHLEIIGESLQRPHVLEHNSEIQLLKEETIKHFSSSDSSECGEAIEKPQELIEEQPLIEYGIKINDQTFILASKRSSKTVNVDMNFICEPFEKVIKRVLRLENIGKKVLNLEWAHRSYYEKTGALLKPHDDDFIFNRKPFRLISGEVYDVVMQFQPRKVNICKEKWVIKIDPQFFCRKMDGVVVKLSGYCTPPPEYTRKLNEMQRLVIEKSNLKMMRKLTTHVGDLTPLITPSEVICPYKRELNELELFEQYNSGYTCERFHDIELLKDLYQRVKKPREKAWDLNLETLKAMILRVPNPERRALLFDEMLGILETMRGIPAELETRGTTNPERDRTRLMYVRGIISAGIDEWEEMAYNLEENFIKPAIKEYYDELVAAEEEEEAGASETILFIEEAAVREIVIKKVRRRKVFRDTLYMQTYTYMCNIIEDMVSSIESTEIV